MDERDVVGIAEEPHDLLRLACAHEAVIDEDAGELLADRLVDQNRSNSAVDAARKTADHPLEADLPLDAMDRLVAERRHRPVATAAADLDDEVAVELAAVRRMNDFGVELHRIKLALLIGDRREGGAVGGADHMKTSREC